MPRKVAFDIYSGYMNKMKEDYKGDDVPAKDIAAATPAQQPAAAPAPAPGGAPAAPVAGGGGATPTGM
jgi:hypothetical protein